MTNRPAPVVSDRTTDYWTGGATGQLRIARCQECRYWLHPPGPRCQRCHSSRIATETVSGRGIVWSFTVNRYPWAPGLEPPYVLAEVELDEQPRLRILTAVVGCDEVRIGLPVHVEFEPAGESVTDDPAAVETWIPVFTP